MANEGVEVLEANNRRVETAKKAAALTARNLQAAKNTVEVATKEHDEATKELKDAEQSLKAAQKQWEVVDLEDDDKGEKPEGNNDSKKRSGASTDLLANASKKVRSDSDSDVPEELLVEGCGVAEVNGTYKRNGDFHGAPRYFKEGQWEGEDVEFVIRQGDFDIWWYILIWIEGEDDSLYYFPAESETSTPPSDGWMISYYGVAPPPKITIKP
eukprot:scaffold4079_cov44-Cyclotella_meneghiniana.AAC.9